MLASTQSGKKNWDAEGANKLHEVLPDLGEDLHKRGEGPGRKRETVICRLRVGHTVWHILIECPDFQDTRRKSFSVTVLYRLFREVNLSRKVGDLRDSVYIEISEAYFKALLHMLCWILMDFYLCFNLLERLMEAHKRE
ncbi:hypothetical protein PoB_001257900 [Plakobranchus ocellatus]|uniref:Uncharacterized protein n=1 Tax=Plakobranchus ocellatus TaxID=259542 RepID=A0AAV3YVJ6_9GAST|nr:hypothetical protein PoB_001257900 [Plakobranchus ocellatus]